MQLHTAYKYNVEGDHNAVQYRSESEKKHLDLVEQ